MQQLSLSLEPGLAQRYRDLRECFAACVYQRGLGRVAAACDDLVALPMRGRIESLNVSATAAVFLYEILQQRLDAST